MLEKMSFNSRQLEAVHHDNGPCCVLAGAGSGKTRILVGRVARLVVNEDIPARNILAVTFTRKAAGEMAERLEELIGPEVEDLNMGTFHSVCYRILKDEWRRKRDKGYEPASEYWQRRALREIIYERLNWNIDLGAALNWIGWQKNNLRGPDDELLRVPPEGPLAHKYRDMYRRYEEKKKAERKLDFDDMLLWCCWLMSDDAGVRARYSTQFRYILVDEYQDTNLVQNEILKLWAKPLNNVFVVGDARQAIYEWRAARVEFILRFEKDWPGARTIVLDTNYRSSSNIVSISNRLIKGAGIAYPGECSAHRGALDEPYVLINDHEDHEAGEVINEIGILVKADDYSLGDCAILFRTNAQARALEDALIAAAVPYVIHGGTGFYARKEVRDILAYLRILEDPDDFDAIARVINVPTRYIGRVFLERAREYAARQGVSLVRAVKDCPEAYQRRYRGAHEFVGCINRLAAYKDSFSPAQMVQLVRTETRYDDWLAEEEGAEEGADSHRIENLNSLVAAAQRFASLKDFLFYAEQAGSRPADTENNADKVQLMTIHRAKGLEFPIVFLAGMNQGLLPHYRSMALVDGKVVPESVEEERRLAYVGMTRAMDRLYLSTSKSYNGKYMEPSMFLKEVWRPDAARIAG
jgi:DNA helicase-2/ATP-dependent DNA helicase PcrA